MKQERERDSHATRRPSAAAAYPAGLHATLQIHVSQYFCQREDEQTKNKSSQRRPPGHVCEHDRGERLFRFCKHKITQQSKVEK